MENPPKSIRLNKADIKNIDAIKVLMRKSNMLESQITQTTVIQWALAQTAKYGQ